MPETSPIFSFLVFVYWPFLEDYRAKILYSSFVILCVPFRVSKVVTFRMMFRFDFLDSRKQGRKDFFHTFSGFRAQRARETPVNGQRVPNPSNLPENT